MITQLAGPYVPPDLSGPVLVDHHGLPRYWAAVWSAAVTGVAMALGVVLLEHVGELPEFAIAKNTRRLVPPALTS